MNMHLEESIPRLRSLPGSLPVEGAIRIELEEGIPILRASSSVQDRVETLLRKDREAGLSVKEAEEFDRYEDIDDYLSFLNRLVRNLFQGEQLLWNGWKISPQLNTREWGT